MLVLVINAGSSSLRFQLINPETTEVKAKVYCDRIGIDGLIIYEVPSKDIKLKKEINLPSHSFAIDKVLKLFVDPELGVIKSMDEIDAVGHRVVHGGEEFKSSVLIDDEVKAKIKDLIPIAPLHNRANLIGIKASEKFMPNVPMVAVFDTAFHQTMPDYAYTYALPYEYYEKFAVRRYGFHGTSHEYVAKEAAKYLGKDFEDLKIITCHLGNGSSITAIDHGKSIDTSMGLTPVAGVPMGTRSGDIDPAVIKYLVDSDDKLTIESINAVLNRRSGVLGVSGLSSDFRDLYAQADKGNKRAQLAINIFSYNAKKYIGAYFAALGSCDLIVFTAGLGENSPRIRADILKGLDFFGIKVDPKLNKAAQGTSIISAKDAPVKVMVVPTNEELSIAKETYNLVSKLKAN